MSDERTFVMIKPDGVRRGLVGEIVSRFERKGLRQSTDVGELERWCAEAIAANPRSVADYKSGNDKAINSFKGAVMKASKGKANPKLVDEILRRLLASA